MSAPSFDRTLGLAGTAVLVTGASGGIGGAIVDALSALGARVVVHYHRDLPGAEALGRAAAAAGNPLAAMLHADLSDAAQCRSLVGQAAEALGGLDVLVNNAGDLIRRVPMRDIDEATYRAVYDLNVGSVLWCSLAAVTALEASRGCIVNIASMAAYAGGQRGSLLYGSSKGAVFTLTRGMARELAPAGVRVNAVAPGTIDTAFHQRHTPAEQLRGARDAVPLGRLGTPADCAGAVVFLASPTLAGFVTGEVINVSGGRGFA